MSHDIFPHGQMMILHISFPAATCRSRVASGDSGAFSARRPRLSPPQGRALARLCPVCPSVAACVRQCRRFPARRLWPRQRGSMTRRHRPVLRGLFAFILPYSHDTCHIALPPKSPPAHFPALYDRRQVAPYRCTMLHNRKLPRRTGKKPCRIVLLPTWRRAGPHRARHSHPLPDTPG